MIGRRGFALGLAAAGLAAPPLARAQALRTVAVIGGGFAGATAAKYLRRFNPALEVTLFEPSAAFLMCPLSNRVIEGGLHMRDLARDYAPYAGRHGLRWVQARVDAVDPGRREVRFGTERQVFDRLVLAPGVEFDYGNIGGMGSATAQARVPHAWKAGPQTIVLRNQLRQMPAGGVVALHIPRAPFRCPPGPYERASLVAHLLQQHNPRAKLLVFDANAEIQSKKGLFSTLWRERHGARVEYVPDAELEHVDAAALMMRFKMHGVQRADVINLIPPQRAGLLATQAGLANVGGRWCGVGFLDYESTIAPGVHMLGDAIQGSPGMPKSGHMANQQAKVCAAAIAALSLGLEPVASPIIANTCYSFVSHAEAVHVAAVFRYDPASRQMVPAPGAGGLSEAPSRVEALYAMAWASNILEDSVG